MFNYGIGEISDGDFGQGDVVIGHGTLLDMLDYAIGRPQMGVLGKEMFY